ncbi:MAG: hypothetical protein AAGI34_16465 [Pseudomonadota bacterium]
MSLMSDLAFPALLVVAVLCVAAFVYGLAYVVAWPFRGTGYRRFVARSLTLLAMVVLALEAIKHLGV